MKSLLDRPHGVMATYVAGCRCHECKVATSVYRRERAAGIKAGTVEVAHGRVGSYSAGCRCVSCCAASTAVKKQRREKWRAGDKEKCPHGTTTGYREYGCRCQPCTDANTVDCLSWKRANVGRHARIRRGIEGRNATFRAEMLERAQRDAEGELAELISEQMRDLGRPERAPSWIMSLDAPYLGESDGDRYEQIRGNGPRHLVEWANPVLDAVCVMEDR